MTLRQLFARRASRPVFRPRPVRLSVEHLEGREVPSVTLRQDPDTDAPNTVPLFLPLTPTNTPAAAVSYTATSSNPAVKTEVIAGGTTLKLDVTGTDSAGQAFSGSITLKLFTD